MRYRYLWGSFYIAAALFLGWEAIDAIKDGMKETSARPTPPVAYDTFQGQLALNPDMFRNAKYPTGNLMEPQELYGGVGSDAKRTRVFLFLPDKK